VTNAPPQNVEFMLAAIGLSDYFEDIVYGEHCPRAKPHPDPYLIGLEKIGLSADNALVFEDSPSGIAAGVAAGLPVIAIATTQDSARLYEAGASLVIEDYHDVVQLIHIDSR
jgi:beta-phosphoglucomutase-like phosphatase (HAD superfamily)